MYCLLHASCFKAHTITVFPTLGISVVDGFWAWKPVSSLHNYPLTSPLLGFATRMIISKICYLIMGCEMVIFKFYYSYHFICWNSINENFPPSTIGYCEMQVRRLLWWGWPEFSVAWTEVMALVIKKINGFKIYFVSKALRIRNHLAVAKK